MKTTPSPLPPADETPLERLLARGYRETTPAFEARWTQLKRELRQPHVHPRRTWAWTGLGWLVPITAVALVLLFVRIPAPLDPTTAYSSLAELWQLNEVLQPALPLLDEENRAAVLHLPANPPNL